jgi:hypothetical protein
MRRLYTAVFDPPGRRENRRSRGRLRIFARTASRAASPGFRGRQSGIRRAPAVGGDCGCERLSSGKRGCYGPPEGWIASGSGSDVPVWLASARHWRTGCADEELKMNEIRPSRSTRWSRTEGELHLAQRSYASFCCGVLAAIAQAPRVRARQPDPTIAKAVFTAPVRIQSAGSAKVCQSRVSRGHSGSNPAGLAFAWRH